MELMIDSFINVIFMAVSVFHPLWHPAYWTYYQTMGLIH